MELEFDDQTLTEKQNMWKTFNDERTDFWISFAFILLESIIPGLAIWILVGNDFTTTMKNNLPSPILGYVILIGISYLIYTGLVTFFCYKMKWHRADNFTYSLTFTCIFITITLIGYGLSNSTMFLVVKFIIVILVAIVCITGAVFMTYLAKNSEIKMQQKFQENYAAWKAGAELKPGLVKKLVKYDKKQQALLAQHEEIESIKRKVQKKINAKLILEEEEKHIKIAKIDKRLELKEEKKRAKDKKIKF
ncbi:hypothetical protein SCLAR_v1c07470 [Spiroplasma clarkii]|uniref:Uncharacterized protein n=2 Tax=Spiroplasma clarkii TaxID=2139 RepID=A0A2K8KN36_9MOLU|nr:hypothetical protein SCLAR_v1c07470 [Spiroplasma clarkii]